MMKSIDKNSIFSLFEQGDEQIYQEYNQESHLENPFVLMGMVVKGLENYQLMDLLYKRNYPNEYKNVSEVVKYKYYTRLYSYLVSIGDIGVDSVYKVGESFDRVEVYNCLEELRLYFEDLEEYEKCGVVKKFRELLEYSW